MSILFFGTEVEHFDQTGTPYNTAALYDPAYTRGSIRIATGQSISKSFTPGPRIFARARIATDSGAWSGSSQIMLIRGAGATGEVCRMTVVAFTTVQFQRWNGSGWSTMGANLAVGANAQNTIAWDIKIGVDGWIKVHLNGQLYAEFIGNTSGISQPGWIYFTGFDGGDEAFISEVVVADHDIREARVKALPPTGAGFHSQWAGTFADINTLGKGDTTSISTATAADKSTFVHGGLNADGLLVEGVKVTTRAKRGESGPQNIDRVLRIGGVDYAANVGVLDTMPLDFREDFLVNPATGLAWTRAEVNALEFGVEAKA